MIGLLRPIEIHNDNNRFDIATGGAPTTIALTRGVYANIFTLLDNMRLKLIAAGHPVYIALDTDYRIRIITTGTSLDFAATYPDSNLWAILGFDGDQSLTAQHEATYTPSHCFFPTYQPYDGTVFARDQTKSFYGRVASDGSISGVASASPLVTRKIKISSETASKVLIGCTINTSTHGNVTEDWEKERCFETLALQSRTASLVGDVVAYHANCSPKGVYYLNNMSEWVGTGIIGLTLPEYAGGHEFAKTSSPDTYLFCSLPTSGVPDPKRTSRQSTTYYDLALTLQSSAIPSAGWSAP